MDDLWKVQKVGSSEEAEYDFIALVPLIRQGHYQPEDLVLPPGEREAQKRPISTVAEIANSVTEDIILIAKRLYEEERKYEALLEFERARKFDGSRGNILFYLGLLYHGMGKLAEAEKSYREAIEAGWKIAIAYNNIGVIKVVSGELEDAIASFESAIDSGLDLPMPHYNLATVFNHLWNSSLNPELEITVATAVNYAGTDDSKIEHVEQQLEDENSRIESDNAETGTISKIDPAKPRQRVKDYRIEMREQYRQALSKEAKLIGDKKQEHHHAIVIYGNIPSDLGVTKESERSGYLSAADDFELGKELLRRNQPREAIELLKKVSSHHAFKEQSRKLIQEAKAKILSEIRKELKRLMRDGDYLRALHKVEEMHRAGEEVEALKRAIKTIREEMFYQKGVEFTDNNQDKEAFKEFTKVSMSSYVAAQRPVPDASNVKEWSRHVIDSTSIQKVVKSVEELGLIEHIFERKWVEVLSSLQKMRAEHLGREIISHLRGWIFEQIMEDFGHRIQEGLIEDLTDETDKSWPRIIQSMIKLEPDVQRANQILSEVRKIIEARASALCEIGENLPSLMKEETKDYFDAALRLDPECLRAKEGLKRLQNEDRREDSVDQLMADPNQMNPADDADQTGTGKVEPTGHSNETEKTDHKQT